MDLGTDATGDNTYTDQLKLSPEQSMNPSFLHELACRMEDWTGVEVLSVQREGHRDETDGSMKY
ncbi:hypothetical protein NUH87_06030 [Pseudomonas batumici]|uniref:hypothetical protein n=1 Tax=Pseudomonas batumici TaxID=226910 RepID=UPI0030D2E8A1